MQNTHLKRVLIAILTVTIIGAVMSAYLLALHYQTGPSFCAIGEVVNCDLVNKGPYGEIGGIPVAAIGFVGYLVMAGLALVVFFKADHRALWLLRGAGTLGFLFSLWLLYLELFVILAICPFCMTSLILITIITSLAWALPSHDGTKAEPPSNEHVTHNT